jgi:hypothetical protein
MGSPTWLLAWRELTLILALDIRHRIPGTNLPWRGGSVTALTGYGISEYESSNPGSVGTGIEQWSHSIVVVRVVSVGLNATRFSGIIPMRNSEHVWCWDIWNVDETARVWKY